MAKEKDMKVSHSGKIVEITPEFTSVEIIQASACSACHAKGLCGFADSEAKLIMLPTDPYREHYVGEEVELMMKYTMGLKAVWISYVVPLLILMILVLTLLAVNVHELVAGLIAIAGVLAYYFVIWLFRDRLKNEVAFYIKEN